MNDMVWKGKRDGMLWEGKKKERWRRLDGLKGSLDGVWRKEMEDEGSES